MFGFGSHRRQRRPRQLTPPSCPACATPQIRATFRAYDSAMREVRFIETWTCPRSGCPGNVREQHQQALTEMDDRLASEREHRMANEYEWVRKKALKLGDADKKTLKDLGVVPW